ncbi:hypothetical protein GCM10010363_48930 [Streptomyces omiyaensis]|uniref:hypothetical protein n=1 Tax=Streptomyces omiyaensis TaxID=68247 RepID=UPI0019B654C3|nr:hypothetical protein [Streptomyces omiyaensis]GGY61684.1 hypothetical protein GCM10010363_48930 [Streptomyces omiyaensis]
MCVAGARLLLSQLSRPVLLAVVGGQLQGVDFRRTGGYRSCVPPPRADTARALAGSPQRWAHRFARYLDEAPDSPRHTGRWLLSCDVPLPRWRPAGMSHAEYGDAMLVEGHPDGHVDWFAHSGSWEVLPLRPMPDADDGRVRAYRKQAREGTLPPVLLWWVSGLDCRLVLGGHARLAAAIAESAEPALLELHRTVPRDDLAAGTEEAVGLYEDEPARFAALRAVHGPAVPDGAAVLGPRLARLLHDLDAARRPTWSWPLPGGEDRWRRIAREVTAGRDRPPREHRSPRRTRPPPPGGSGRSGGSRHSGGRHRTGPRSSTSRVGPDRKTSGPTGP